MNCKQYYYDFKRSIPNAPVVNLKDIGNSNYIAETKDGKVRKQISRFHCEWCTKVVALEEWKSLPSLTTKENEK